MSTTQAESSNSLNCPGGLTHAYSLEVSTKDIAALTSAASRITPGTTISVPYLPRETYEARLAAIRAVRQLGFEPMPHFSARRIASHTELHSFVVRAVAEAAIERCLIIAGDPSAPMGPFEDSTALIETGVFEDAGIKIIGIGGHPEGHPVISQAAQWEALERKCQSIENRGMSPLIVTQFTFDVDKVLDWLKALRERGINHPVRIGVPGPAGVTVLARYAAMCGVSACASIWSKYGISLGKLFSTAGPDLFIERLSKELSEAHGQVSLHFFPFGGIAQSLKWIEGYRRRVDLSRAINEEEAGWN